MCTCCSASSTFLLLRQHRSLHQNQSRTSHPGPQSQPEFFHDSLFRMGSSGLPQVLPMCLGRRQPARAWPPRLQSALSFARSRPCTSTRRGSRGPAKINTFSICFCLRKPLTGGGGAVRDLGVGRKTEKVISHWFASLQCDNCFMNPPSIFTLLFSLGNLVCRVENETLKMYVVNSLPGQYHSLQC